MHGKSCWLAACILTLAPGVLAMNSSEVKLTWGSNYLGYKAMTNADLDAGGIWNAGISFSRAQFTDPENPGWNHQIFLELSCFPDDSVSLSGNYSYSRDSNDITAAGPGISAFYTHFRTADADPPVGTSRSQMPADVFTLGFDCPVLFYQTEVETAADPISVRSIRLTQAVPMLFLDFALVPNRLNVSASGNYFIYSEDPVQIAAWIDPALSASGMASLESLMPGLLWMSWQAGLFVTLPYEIQLSGNYGKQKQVYPEEWVDTCDLSLSGRFCGFIKAKAAWQHFSSSAGNSSLCSVALRFYY